jgi:peptidoglycan-N-acetylglucosamine deacetylase
VASHDARQVSANSVDRSRVKKRRRILFVIAACVVAAPVFVASCGPSILPHLLETYRSDVVFRVRGPAAEHTVFLTIDDAPSDKTDAILEVLARHHVTATFFVITNRIDDPTIIERILAAGHHIGNHMPTTKAASKMSLEEFRTDFDQADAILKKFGDVRLFRPPSDFGTREEIAYVRAKNMTTVVGAGYPLDHLLRNPTRIRFLARWLATDGAIIILHDGHDRGARTAAILDKLIPDLRRRGYEFGDLETALREDR